MMGCERQRRGYLGWFILPRFGSGLNQINCLQKISLAFRDVSCHNNARFSLQLAWKVLRLETICGTGECCWEHWANLVARLASIHRFPCRRLTEEHERKDVFVTEHGVVKWFSGAKGYGFIQRSTGEDVFVHFSAIQENGFKTLNEGDAVDFECQQGPKGLNATNVVRNQPS